ncbi:YacL family protein [Celerinatantimonas sp. YJH-8]|uniref:YacL family protein n=1 Tax=Celerinatantimonas sp. YJH-8 TaxID=3228714 RepID=UPI0038C62708
MDIELHFLGDGRFSLDCGDAHRALALWLEQGWFDGSFQQQLLRAYEVSQLPLQIRGVEFTAQIDQEEVLVFSNVEPIDEIIDGDEAYQLSMIDAYAGCGYEDFIHLIDYIKSSY